MYGSHYENCLLFLIFSPTLHWILLFITIYICIYVCFLHMWSLISDFTAFYSSILVIKEDSE